MTIPRTCKTTPNAFLLIKSLVMTHDWRMNSIFKRSNIVKLCSTGYYHFNNNDFSFDNITEH